jgi:hypothetical protein
MADETSHDSGFRNASDRNEYSWTAQSGATGYEVVRSWSPDFNGACTFFATAGTSIVDTEQPTVGEGFYYLNRSTQPNPGSWGPDSTGQERTPGC